MNDTPDLEQEFINEQKGEGSLAIYLINGDDAEYVGFDLHPEDLEAIYFEGIGVPRWESLKAETVEQQTAMYWEQFNERMGNYPMIGRIRDTDKVVEFADSDVPVLLAECENLAGSSTDAKALRSLHKFSIPAGRAAGANSGLRFKPSTIPDIDAGS